MAHTKAAVAGKTAKAREAKAKRLEKRVAKLEKEKEEEKGHTKYWRSTYLKEQRDFVEYAWELISKKRNGEAPEVAGKTAKGWQALTPKTLTPKD